MQLAAGSGSAISLAIPFDKINRITYTKANPARGILVLVGLGVGVVAGALAGAALAPEPERWLEFPDLFWGTVGAVVGGLIGAAGGWGCGKHMRITVTLRCR